MSSHKTIPCIYLKNKVAVAGFGSESILSEDVIALAVKYNYMGANEIIIFDLSDTDAEHEEALHMIREINRNIDIPTIGAGNIKRFEDVKKIIYAGCKKAALNMAKHENIDLLEEVSKRFGKDKITACVDAEEQIIEHFELLEKCCSEVILINNIPCSGFKTLSVICVSNEIEEATISSTAICQLSWSNFKLNTDGQIPVIVQDYKTSEVLMLAYMNEESFQQTVATGLMTYYSRSRKELWIKGETSGHLQYVKELIADCDNDTILAKVAQIGVACHTGNRSCFFHEILKNEYNSTNPLKVFEDVYRVILDRKKNPKEGSYTNYLFDKGIDKILKKLGEESTEIVIAAKNPDVEEVKYEMSDYLYHMMVLMAECDITWQDITKELANR